ncbi:MAG TPA: hypothetical protein VGJ36_03485, partial [Gemmatimonadales bacterium]
MKVPTRRTAPLSVLILALARVASAQQPASDTAKALVLVPDAVWDGVANAPASGWVVLVRGKVIDAVGPASEVIVPREADRIELAGTTLIPGLIEGHSHLFLHPYNEATWDDQVLREPIGQRMARAVA